MPAPGSPTVARQADAAARTDAELRCLTVLRERTGVAGGPLEAHSLRVYEIALRLADARPAPVDREVLLCAALLHDVGLYPDEPTSKAYVTSGRVLTERVLRACGWPEPRIALCGDAVEHHHELVSQERRGAEVELVRRADLVEVSQGLIRFGIERVWLADLRRRIPPTGFLREIATRLAVAARDRPLSLPRIFKP